MSLTRRTFLGTASGATLALTGCRGLSQPPRFSAPARAGSKVRVAGLYNAAVNGPSEHLTILLQRAVDQLIANGRTDLDPRLVWVPVPPSMPGRPGQPLVLGEVGALEAALGSSGLPPFPDLVALGSSYILQQVAKRRLLRPLDDLVQTTSVLSSDDYFPGALAAGKMTGKLYGLPLSITPALLQYDPQRLQEASLLPPDASWDWNRLLEASLKLTRAPKQYAFAPYGVPDFLVFLWQNEADVLSADGRRCTLTDQAAISAATFYGDLFTRVKVVAPAPQGSGAVTGFNPTNLDYNASRIAMQFSSVLSTPPSRGYRYAEPFHGKTQATLLQLGGLVAMTSRVADPPAAFGVLAALAEELQRGSFLPPQRSLAAKANPGHFGLSLDAVESAALLCAAEYARASPVDIELNTLMSSKLEAPMRTGTATATEACQAAAAAINALLAARAAG